jgi:hypothetical protein
VTRYRGAESRFWVHGISDPGRATRPGRRRLSTQSRTMTNAVARVCSARPPGAWAVCEAVHGPPLRQRAVEARQTDWRPYPDSRRLCEIHELCTICQGLRRKGILCAYIRCIIIGENDRSDALDRARACPWTTVGMVGECCSAAGAWHDSLPIWRLKDAKSGARSGASLGVYQ